MLGARKYEAKCDSFFWDYKFLFSVTIVVQIHYLAANFVTYTLLYFKVIPPIFWQTQS